MLTGSAIAIAGLAMVALFPQTYFYVILPLGIGAILFLLGWTKFQRWLGS
jgi:hypothetical protein